MRQKIAGAYVSIGSIVFGQFFFFFNQCEVLSLPMIFCFQYLQESLLISFMFLVNRKPFLTVFVCVFVLSGEPEYI